MAEITVAHFEQLSQRLSSKFKLIEDLMTQAWLEHELARESFRQLYKTYHEWLGKEGLEYKL